MFITDDIKYVGVNDHETDLFEGMYVIENGMAYNSYVIMDEKIAVFDSVEAKFGDEWLKNVENALGGRTPDYLVVLHMEPDHSANIKKFTDKYNSAIVLATAKAFTMMKQFFGIDYADRRVIVTENDTLNLGKHTLTFITAPMVHWPEVMVAYDSFEKVLFSADAFGKFGALDADEDWACEARRYYMGIVGKYGAQVQTLLKKAAALDIKIICPLHGPVLLENLEYYINLYNIWSSYEAESKGVMIAYSSVYGHTKAAAEKLCELLKEKGCPKVVVCDLAREDMAEAVEDAFRYDRLVLASVTYNGDAFPHMREFIHNIVERNYQKRTVAFIENGSWAPTAAKVMKNMLESCKNINYAETTVSIKSALTSENIDDLNKLAEELA